MRKLNPEELAQLNLMRETIAEMHGEVNDMDEDQVTDIKVWLGYTWTKISVVLARHGAAVFIAPPTPPPDESPF